MTTDTKFGSSMIVASDVPDRVLSVIAAVQKTVALESGWHTVTITFKLDKAGAMERLDEYKVSSFGAEKPNAELKGGTR